MSPALADAAPSRWRHPPVPVQQALLLLPRVPRDAWVDGRDAAWERALSSLGVSPRPEATGAPSDLVVTRRARTAATTGSDLVLLLGADRGGSLARAGYLVRRYTVVRGPGGVLVLQPAGRRRRPLRVPRSDGPRSGTRPRELAVRAIRCLHGRSYVTVASHGALTPAAVATAVGPAKHALLVAGGGVGGARRRSTFLVSTGEGPPDAVVKVTRAEDRNRGQDEQRVLRRLQDHDALRSSVPRPRGEGTLGPLCWSAESLEPGVPLPDYLRWARPTDSLGLLEDLAAWWTRVATLTRTDDWDPDASTLPLRGPAQQLAASRLELAGVPGVLVHGDVGSGGNVLVFRHRFGTIDWETTREADLPLTDLLPLLCLALAVRARAEDPADYVVRLCAGETPESPWLLAQVRHHLREVGIPLALAGRLAGLAWGYQASMRLVNDELVRAAGQEPRPWTSPAEGVLRQWVDHPTLGREWTALTGGGDS